MDNLLDLAILEFRSAETGDVIRQFPTERQIAAFQQAAELDTSQEERSFEQAESFSPVQATNAQSEIAPIVTPIATPSPSPSISTSYSASGGGEVSQSPSGGETTQSILV